MKKVILTVALALGLGLSASAQLLNVGSIDKINLPDGVKADHAYLSPTGDYLVFSEIGHAGLKSLDLNSGTVTVVSPAASGMDVKFTADGNQVVFRENSFNNHRRFTSVKAFDKTNAKTVTLVKPTRELQGVAVEGNTAVTVAAGRSGARALDGGKIAVSRPVFSIDRGMMYKTVNGKTTAFSPLGEGSFSYLWPSLSPDGLKVVFYAAGYGTYTCDLDGGNLTPVGRFIAPVWYNNDVLVAMVDENDGVTTTKSTIMAVSADGSETQALTDDSLVAMLPAVAGNTIVFTTVDGGLYSITLK